MAKKLRILLLEDVPGDAELISRELGKVGLPFSLERVETEDAFVRRLELDFDSQSQKMGIMIAETRIKWGLSF